MFSLGLEFSVDESVICLYEMRCLEADTGIPGGTVGKNLPARRHKRRGFHPWVRKIPWRRKWQPTPVFLPGKLHGQRNLAGHSPWGYRVKDERTHAHTHTRTHTHTHRRIKQGSVLMGG